MYILEIIDSLLKRDLWNIQIYKEILAVCKFLKRLLDSKPISSLGQAKLDQILRSIFSENIYILKEFNARKRESEFGVSLESLFSFYLSLSLESLESLSLESLSLSLESLSLSWISLSRISLSSRISPFELYIY